ncbi:MAG: fused MFS/spermidine synthase [Deltaproteobacteria bacterium]|nr:fused MFS/spermidine synthase [Deltaproteobacteria bacterium]
MNRIDSEERARGRVVSTQAAPALAASARGAGWFLFSTALVCGAAVMVIEVMGSRVIGPFFGVSLFVWTSLISVTLIALAAGYAVGGRLADRWETAGALSGLIAAAGCLTAAVPWLKGPVLAVCLSLGLRVGAFASAALLFGPALFCLGCVSPYLVKLAARELRRIGSTVGTLYALSTLGSVAGTLVAGFLLAAFLGVGQLFQLTGGGLILWGAVPLVVSRPRRAPLLLLGALAVVPAPGGKAAQVLPGGTVATLAASVENFYGAVKVVDYRFGPTHTRELVIDGLVQGGIDIASGLPVYEYFYGLQWLPTAIHPGGRRCLVVGLGAGLVPSWYERNGILTDSVDINPEVVRLAREHFGFAPRGAVHVEDARAFLSRTGEVYDYVILDVFNGDAAPPHLLSVESFRSVRARMVPGGVLAVNFMGDLGARRYMTASVVRTMEAVFSTVQIYPTFDPAAGGQGNLVLLAYDGPDVTPPADAFASGAVHPLAVAARQIPGWRFRLPPGERSVILTDDYNPIDLYDVHLHEAVRRRILADTPWGILLGASAGRTRASLPGGAAAAEGAGPGKEGSVG